MGESTVYVNLSPEVTNAYSSLWLEAMSATARVQPIALARSLRPSRGDVLHLHWPDHFYPSRYKVVAWVRLVWLLAWLAALRVRGASIVVTVHNVAAHDRTPELTDRLFWGVLPWLVHGVVVHAQCGRDIVLEARRAFRRVPILAVPHPLYPRTSEPRAGRARTHISTLGSMRPYKRVDQLVGAYEQAVAEGRQLPPLYVAGQLSTGMEPTVRRLHELKEAGTNVQVDWRQLEDAELEGAIDRSIAVAIPHLPSVASGSMIQVLSLGSLLVAPDGPLTRELAADFPGQVLTYREPLGPDDLLEAVRLSQDRLDDHRDRPFGYQWSENASVHIDFYRRLSADREGATKRSHRHEQPGTPPSPRRSKRP